MFNREESKKYVKGKISKNILLKTIGISLISLTLFNGLSNIQNHEDRFMENHFAYEKKKIEYIQRVQEYQEKDYDSRVIELYNNGMIKIDNQIYPLHGFFIRYNIINGEVDLHLMCTGCGYTDILIKSNAEYNYNGITRFKNTEAFIDLLNSDAVIIEGNCITIVDKVKALEIINNWNGMLHSLVPETDAKENKQVFFQGESGYEKSR